MKFLKKLALVVLVLFGLFTAGGFLVPRHWTVERSILIKATPEAIFPLVANLHTGWPQWSAFDFQTQDISYTLSGPALGEGSTRVWTSKKMGNGKQVITKSHVFQGVNFTLTMDNGFAMEGKIIFNQEADGQTKVTWIDTGDSGNNPYNRYLGLIMDMMMGPTFEASLLKLKEKSEVTL